jgi:ubiquitin-conjugating enzyme E2 Z
MAPTALALKRAARDVMAATQSAALKEQGIYYIPDESNIMHGIAMLVGKKDTPYVGGYYFFDVTFSEDYPFAPLQLKSLTQDGATRFNPNLYVDGKVCLSILNTWHDGPQWCGIQTLESVLMVIMSDVLCEVPLQGEPAYRTCGLSDRSQIYNRIVFYSNVRTSVLKMLGPAAPPFAALFKAQMEEHYIKNKEALIAVLKVHEMFDGKQETCQVYNMSIKYNYKVLSTQVSAVL